MSGQSGADLGKQNVEALRRYIGALERQGAALPARNGKINVSAVALACGFDRAVLYQNPAAKRELAEAAARLGLDGMAERPADASAADPRDERIRRLEQQNAALLAENHDLRRQVARLRHIEEHMAETGRRVAR